MLLFVFCILSVPLHGKGFYAGAQYSYLQQKLSLYGDVEDNAPGEIPHTGRKGDQKTHAFGVVGGYEFYTSQRIACSAELNVNKSSFSVSQLFLISPDRGYGLHIKRKYDIMPALSLKYRLDGFHPYIKLGVMFARFHSKEYIILDRQKLGGDKKFWHISLIGAVGQDIPLTPNIDLRMESLISGPGKNEKRIKESEHFLDVMRKISITKAFKLGIIYKF